MPNLPISPLLPILYAGTHGRRLVYGLDWHYRQCDCGCTHEPDENHLVKEKDMQTNQKHATGTEDFFAGKWNDEGKVKEEWGDLTDDDLREIDGKREKLAGRLQARYGWDRWMLFYCEMDNFRTRYNP